jgi:hypothetical protein
MAVSVAFFGVQTPVAVARLAEAHEVVADKVVSWTAMSEVTATFPNDTSRGVWLAPRRFVRI